VGKQPRKIAKSTTTEFLDPFLQKYKLSYVNNESVANFCDSDCNLPFPMMIYAAFLNY
jgi:hypothetical protein